MSILKLLEKAFYVAVKQAHPDYVLEQHLPDLPKGRLVTVAVGKAAAAMARVAEKRYEDKISGIALTRYGHGETLEYIKLIEAAHPVPDSAGLKASQEIARLVKGLNKDDLLLCLISGGASALLTLPDGISLVEKIDLNQKLLSSGAAISEMNTVRKHFSKLKGGRLAKLAFPAKVISLIISDVVGDDLSIVASGPTVPDKSSYRDALNILTKYNIRDSIYYAHLQKGIQGEIEETVKENNPIFENVENVLLASNQKSLEAVKAFFEKEGIASYILSSYIEGEAREAAKFHAAIARQILEHNQPFKKPCVLISGGETTVTLKGKGKGGRNSEFLLALAIELYDYPNVNALAADTDGIDGSEDNAGAFFDSGIAGKVARETMIAYLDDNDSYSFFKQYGGLFISGPTKTNVNDLRLIFLS